MNKYTVRVNVDLYYEFDEKEFPGFASPDGVAKLVECAFNDFGSAKELSDFESRLDRAPVEIANVKFTEA